MSETTRTDVMKASLNAIRDELLALWASEALNDEAVIRARTHNLVVYLSGSRYPVADTVQRFIDLTAQRPGRVILIQDDPDREKPPDAWLTVYCRAQGHRQLCGELVVLEVGGGLSEDISSTVVSLLAPDLPVYLWWAEPPDPSHRLFATLNAEAERVLVDSDSFDDPLAGLATLASLEGVRLADLSWARLTLWRRLIAQLWDIPDLREALNYIRTLRVSYAVSGGSGNPARALLLVGWLADRLGWEVGSALQRTRLPEGKDGYVAGWASDGWQGRVEVVEVESGAIPSGEIIAVTIEAGEQPPGVTACLQAEPERGCVEVRLDDASPAGARRGSLFEPITTAAALAEELDSRYDPYYELALRRTVAMILGRKA